MSEPVTFTGFKKRIFHDKLYGRDCTANCPACLLESLEQQVRELRDLAAEWRKVKTKHPQSIWAWCADELDGKVNGLLGEPQRREVAEEGK